MSTLAPERQPDTGPMPPLENGDRLTRAEFERRYFAAPPNLRAELIEGVVHVASPVHVRHAEVHLQIAGCVYVYTASTPGVRRADNVSLRIDQDNAVQPDVCLWTRRSNVREVPAGEHGMFLEGAPELIVEVASSSASYDLHDKLNVYRRNGVREYLVLLTYEQEFRWYVWEEGRYRQLPPSVDGIYRSEAFPGFWLDTARFWADDSAGVNAVIQQGVATPEHKRFVESLASG